MKTAKQYIKNPNFGQGDEPEFIPVMGTGISEVKNRLLQVERQNLNITIRDNQNYASLTEAIAAVTDDKYKFKGFVLTFNNGTEWKNYVYNGADASGFTTESNWEEYSLGNGGSGSDIEISENEPTPGDDASVVYQIEEVPDEEVVEYVTEAPADDNEYVRKNKGWVRASSGSTNGPSAEITKESVEAVLTGNIESHTHDTVYAPAETDVWDGVTVSESLLGTGTEEDPYQINSCADWLHYINNGKLYSPSDVDFNNPKYTSINKNLDFNNKEIDFSELFQSSINGFSETLLNYVIITNNIEGNNNSIFNFKCKNGSIMGICMMSSYQNLNISGEVIYDNDSLFTSASDGKSFVLLKFFGLPIKIDTKSELLLSVVGNSNINLKVSFLPKNPINRFLIYFSPIEYADTETGQIGENNKINKNQKNVKINCVYEFNNNSILEGSTMVVNHIDYIYYNDGFSSTGIDSCSLGMTKPVNFDGNEPQLIDGLIVIPLGFMLAGDTNKNIDVRNSYILSDYTLDGIKSIPKSESELKDPSFLDTLNSASGENIWITGKDGFPTLNMQQKGAIQYDGYVKQSEFDELKKNPAFNEGVVYIPYDVLFNTSNVTREEASAILGGNEGLQKIIEGIKEGKKLKISNITDNVAYSDIKTSIFQFDTIIGLNFKTVVVSPFGMGDLSCLIYYENNGELSVYSSVTLLEKTKYKGEQ